MATDAIDRVSSPALRAVLDAHRDQVRAGARVPGRRLLHPRARGRRAATTAKKHTGSASSTPTSRRSAADPTCSDLTDPTGPCAATVAHLMGVAGHGMGDEVWDWMFEPNGPGFGEPAYLPPAFTPFAGPGGLELQLDLEAIMRHGAADRTDGRTPGRRQDHGGVRGDRAERHLRGRAADR